MKKQPAYYIDNKRFHAELCEYKKACRKAHREKRPEPAAGRYIGECLLLLSRRIATKACFNNYSFLDEMISDGVENSIQYGLSNFNPKMPNAFSYFTQIIFLAFIRRIQKEEKQQYVKLKNMNFHQLSEQLADNTYMPVNNRDFDEFIAKFEAGMAKKKNRGAASANTIEAFLGPKKS